MLFARGVFGVRVIQRRTHSVDYLILRQAVPRYLPGDNFPNGDTVRKDVTRFRELISDDNFRCGVRYRSSHAGLPRRFAVLLDFG